MNLAQIPNMKSPTCLWFFSPVGLAVPISAQTGTKATEQTPLQIIQTDELSFSPAVKQQHGDEW